MAPTIFAILHLGVVAVICQHAPDSREQPLPNTNLAEWMQKVDERLQQLEARNQHLETQNKELQTQTSELRTQNKNLETKVQQLVVENEEFYSRVLILEFKVRGQTHTKTADHAPPSHDVEVRADDTSPLQPVVTQMAQHLTEIDAQVQALKTADQQHSQAIQQAGTSVYVRWGRSVCPDSTHLVYSGVIGGSWFDHSGAATNYLCLTLSPVPSNHPVPSYYANLYGGEYETFDTHMDMDPVCAVCRSPRPTTIMVPGTNVCLPGWTQEYSGYLMAGRYTETAGSEYICVDGNLEERIGTTPNNNGAVLYYTVARCGSLPCAPYVDAKIVTCAVCSQ